MDIYLLGLDDAVMDEFIANNKVGDYAVYAKMAVTHDQYACIPADAPITTIGVTATYIVSNTPVSYTHLYRQAAQQCRLRFLFHRLVRRFNALVLIFHRRRQVAGQYLGTIMVQGIQHRLFRLQHAAPLAVQQLSLIHI